MFHNFSKQQCSNSMYTVLNHFNVSCPPLEASPYIAMSKSLMIWSKSGTQHRRKQRGMPLTWGQMTGMDACEHLIYRCWIEVGPGTKMKVLWRTHLKELWVELTVLRLLNVTTSVSASFEVHDEGTAAQQLVQKAVGQGVLVHPGRRRELHRPEEVP